MKDFNNKVAVITGAASGIGRSLAIQLAARGCRLALADVDREGLSETRSLLAASVPSCTTHLLDVADRDAFEAFADDVVREHGTVNLLFNNAGVTLVDRVESLRYEDFEWVMNINFWGVVYGTKAFLPHLQAADQAHIINISSLFGLMATPNQAAYNASKFAVRGFTEALKMEMSGSHVNVTCVHPGGIRTGIARNSRFGLQGESITKDDLAAAFEKAAKTTADEAVGKIIRGIEKNKRRILIGPDARWGDFFVRMFPGSYEKYLGLEKSVRARAAHRAAADSA